jgi:hypothetical protein
MSKYASILFAPEKFHEVGPFRFPIYEHLTPGESRTIEEITRKQTKSAFKSIKLAQRIGRDKSITTKEAMKLLENADKDENEDLLYDYVDELEKLQESGVGAVEQKVSWVTPFMQYRGEVKLSPEADWQQTSDWSEADTEKMPPHLLDSVFQLILWERDGWPTPGAEGNAPEGEETPISRRKRP